jgi:hypothetical protein
VQSRLVLPLFVLGLVASRIAAVLTSTERVSFVEELYRGVIARELIEGLKAPLWAYQADSYQGGSLVVGALAAPLFQLFGPRLVVLKAVPLLFAVATLVLLFLFLDQVFGRAAAVIGAALVVLAPPGATALSLLAMGFHTESVVFSLLILLGWYGFAFGRVRPSLALGLFGLATGAAISFTYVPAVTAAGCLASWPVLRPRCRPRAIVALVIGFALGVAPWVLYNVTHDFDGLRFAVGVFAGGRATSWPAEVERLARKAATLLLYSLPVSYDFAPLGSVSGRLLSSAYAALAALGIAHGCASHASAARKLLPVVLSGALLLLALVVSHYEAPRSLIDARVLAPLHVLMYVMVAATVGASRVRRVVTGLLLALGLVGQATLVTGTMASNVVAYRGYAYLQLGELWYARLEPGSTTFTATRAALERLSETDRRLTYWGAFERQQADWTDVARLVPRIDAVPAPYRIYFAGAAGEAAGRRGTLDGRTLDALTASMATDERDHFLVRYIGAASGTVAIRDYESALGQTPASLRSWVDVYLGWLVGQTCSDPGAAAACADAVAVAGALPPGRQAQVYRGLGQWKGSNWARPDGLDEHPVPVVVPPAFADDVAWGAGWALRDRFREDRLRVFDWLDRLSPAVRPAARRGVRAYDAWHRLEEGQ